MNLIKSDKKGWSSGPFSMLRTAFSIFLCSISLSCRQTDTFLIAESFAIDSFLVTNVIDLDDYMTFEFSDTTATSYSGNQHTFTRYKKEGDSFVLLNRLNLTNTGPAFHGYLKDSDQIHIINSNNQWITYKGGKEVSRASYIQSKNFLADNYLITGLPTIPLTLWGDTLLSTFYYNTPDGYVDYFKEPSITESVRKDSVVLFVGNYIPKPANLINYALPFPKYCLRKNTVVLIYPCFDTIYSYNRSEKVLKRVPIHNRDYSTPQKWNRIKMFSPTFNSYRTAYELRNFQYQSIRYNPLTDHFLLFYVVPAKATNDKNPTYNDQELRLLVLDNSFEKIGYYRFERKYFSPENFSFIDNKGFALPLFKSKFDYAASRFLIYNF